MFERPHWDKLPECIFESFEIAQVKQEQFQNFQKPRGWFILKISRTKHVINGSSHQTNKHFVLKLISFNKGRYKSASGQLQNRGQLENNSVNGAVIIIMNCMINTEIANDQNSKSGTRFSYGEGDFNQKMLSGIDWTSVFKNAGIIMELWMMNF